VFRILHLTTADFVRDGNHTWYQAPPYLEFEDVECAALFIRQHIFIYKFRGEWYGVLSKIPSSPIDDGAVKELTKIGVWVPRYQLEIVEVV
jgi:hypothetical protein